MPKECRPTALTPRKTAVLTASNVTSGVSFLRATLSAVNRTKPALKGKDSAISRRVVVPSPA